MTLLTYSLSVFFAFYLLNYSAVFSEVLRDLTTSLREWVTYPFQCAFCFTFWTTLALGFFVHDPIPFTFLFTAPVAVLFIDLAYRRLRA